MNNDDPGYWTDEAKIKDLSLQATDYCSRLMKLDEVRLQERISFLTWIVGIGSAGLFMIMSKTTTDPSQSVATAWPTITSFRDFIILFYFVLIISSLAFRLTVNRVLMGIHMSVFALEVQRSFMVSEIGSQLHSWKIKSVSQFVNTLMLFNFLNEEQRLNYLKQQEVDRKWEKINTTCYYFALLSFLGFITTMLTIFFSLFVTA